MVKLLVTAYKHARSPNRLYVVFKTGLLRPRWTPATSIKRSLPFTVENFAIRDAVMHAAIPLTREHLECSI